MNLHFHLLFYFSSFFENFYFFFFEARFCKNIKKKDAKDYILGYLLSLDITERDIQTQAKKNGWPWTIAKGFDTFAPISEIILKNQVRDPNNLDLLLKVNGKIRQKSNTKYMIFSIERIIEFISDEIC